MENNRKHLINIKRINTKDIYDRQALARLPLGTASKFPALSIKLLATILFKEYPITSFHSVGLGQWAHSNSSRLLYILLFASINLLAAGLAFSSWVQNFNHHFTKKKIEQTILLRYTT